MHVLVREPDQLGVERAHPQLAFGVRLVKLAQPNRHIAANYNRAPANLDDDDLHAGGVPRRRHQSGGSVCGALLRSVRPPP